MNTGNTSTSLVVTDVPAGIYYVRVRGANAHGPSAPSPEITVVVGGDTRCHAAPQRPTALKATVHRLTATLGWTAPAGGCSPTHYVLVAGSAAGRSNLAQAAVTGETLTAGAAPGTYYVRVMAVNAFGISTPSNEIVVTLRP
jgi:predicted phage tail protein